MEMEEMIRMVARHLRYAVIRRNMYNGNESIVFKSPKRDDADQYVAQFKKIGDNCYIGNTVYTYHISTVWHF